MPSGTRRDRVERVEGLLASVQDLVATLQKLGSELEHEVAQALYQDSSVHGTAQATLELENARLRLALEGRAVIEQAKGIIIAGQGCTAEEAFAVLTRISRRSSRPPREVAAGIVRSGTAPIDPGDTGSGTAAEPGTPAEPGARAQPGDVSPGAAPPGAAPPVAPGDLTSAGDAPDPDAGASGPDAAAPDPADPAASNPDAADPQAAPPDTAAAQAADADAADPDAADPDAADPDAPDPEPADPDTSEIVRPGMIGDIWRASINLDEVIEGKDPVSGPDPGRWRWRPPHPSHSSGRRDAPRFRNFGG